MHIDLVEYEPRLISKSVIPDTLGIQIWQNFAHQIAVEFPSHRTDHQWRFTSLGWVGTLQIGSRLRIDIHPKVPIRNLFRMLNLAYALKSFTFTDHITDASSLPEVFDILAEALARRVQYRLRIGLYQTYRNRNERLTSIKGRIDPVKMSQAPWIPDVPCRYQENTCDVEENQIVLWSLHSILNSNLGNPRVCTLLHQTMHQMLGRVSLKSFDADACLNRSYNRLNADYEILHVLARFFLEHTGPVWKSGNKRMCGFMVNMARLFESFVASWLKHHLPDPFFLSVQERLALRVGTYFQVDLVVYGCARDETDSRPLCVLDTKYKSQQRPSTDDIAQVVTYALSRGCTEAILVYPTPPVVELDEYIGTIRVRTICFDLSSDLDRAGEELLHIFGDLSYHSALNAEN